MSIMMLHLLMLYRDFNCKGLSQNISPVKQWHWPNRRNMTYFFFVFFPIHFYISHFFIHLPKTADLSKC